MLSHRIHPELPTTFFFFPPFSQLRSKDIDRVWVFSNTRNPLPSLCSRNECKVFVCGRWVRKTAMRENTTLKCMSEGWTRIIGRRKVFSNTSKRKLNGKCKGRKFLSVSEVNKVSLDQNMKWFFLIYNWDFQEYWNSGWFRNTTFIKLIHTHTCIDMYEYNIEHKIPLAMLMTYKLQLAFSQFFSHAFLSSFLSSFLYVSLQYWTVEIGVETRWILKNENTEGGAGAMGTGGYLLIMSGLPFKQTLFVMELTQIWNGAGWLFAAYDFDSFRWCRWRTHLVFYHWFTRWYSISVFVVQLASIFYNTELLYRLHNVMRLRGWCRRDVRLFVILWRLNEFISMIIQVVEDVQVMILVNNFRWRLVKHLRKFFRVLLTL